MARLGSWMLLVASVSLDCGGRTDAFDLDDGSSTGGSTSGGHAAGGMRATTGGVTPTTGGVTSTTGGTRQTTGGVTMTSGGTPNPASGGVPSTGGTTPSNTGGAASAGSGGAGVPRCVPGASMNCSCNGLPGAQRCNADGFYDLCQCGAETLEWFRQEIVGKWVGTRQSPWDGAPNVTLDFTAEGTWSGSCSGPNPIFYWGDSSGRYRLVSVNTDPEAFGELSVQFGSSSSQQGSLRHIRFNNADQSQLKFEFWRTWGGEYGPLEFDLRRP